MAKRKDGNTTTIIVYLPEKDHVDLKKVLVPVSPFISRTEIIRRLIRKFITDKEFRAVILAE